MNDKPKTITEFKAEERRQERAQNRLAFFERLRSVVTFFLIMAIIAYSFVHRARIENISRAAIHRVMNHFTLPPELKQKSVDYQNQIDGVTTN